MAASSNQVLSRREGSRESVPVAASVQLFDGTLAFLTVAGYLTNLIAQAVKFAGTMVGEADNSAGSAGDIRGEVRTTPDVVLLTGSGFTQATVGRRIYATDDYAVTATPGVGVFIGHAVEYVSATQMWVKLCPSDERAHQTVIPDDAEGTGNTIAPYATEITVGAVTNDANDFVVLPPLSSVPPAHTITVVGGAGANFEVRTPAASNEEINSEDCDGTKEYLFTDTQIHYFTKISDTVGWMAHGHTAIGAAVTPVVPD